MLSLGEEKGSGRCQRVLIPVQALALEVEGEKMGDKKKWEKHVGEVTGQGKVHKVMSEFKRGTLHSGKSKKKVTKRKQAIAIAMSEAGLSWKKKKK